MAARAETNGYRADGGGTSRKGELTFAATGNVRPTKKPLNPMADPWVPKSAARVRAEAGEIKRKQAREQKARSTKEQIDGRRRLWREQFNSQESWDTQEAIDAYAEWVGLGVIEEDEPRHDFYPADEYNGQMDGWVYKLGQAGMGYYLDGVVEAPALELHKLIWPTDGLVPVELNLDRMLDIKARVGDPATATTEDEKVRKRTAQKQRKKKARDKQGIDLVSQYVDGLMVDAADVSHREKGWWAFDTVNPNAMGGCRKVSRAIISRFCGITRNEGRR